MIVDEVPPSSGGRLLITTFCNPASSDWEELANLTSINLSAWSPQSPVALSQVVNGASLLTNNTALLHGGRAVKSQGGTNLRGAAVQGHCNKGR